MAELVFNPIPPKVMHIDVNSCFATIEQQANPFLRGRPIAVVAYNSPRGCILAPSIEAKRYGVKTGMRLFEGKALCPGLLAVDSDPDKYRHVHLAFRKILSKYTNDFVPKSIDEFVLNLDGYPCLKNGMINVATEIKSRVKTEIGDWISVSIGIGPNRFLAKTASNLKKPDGLETIDKDNYLDIYAKLKAIDLCGIKKGYGTRLARVGISTVLDFYQATLWKLKVAFASIGSYYWYLRLRGYEIDGVDWARKSYGNTYSLPTPLVGLSESMPILAKLVEKTSFRLRKAGFCAQGVHLGLLFRDRSFWHMGRTFEKQLFSTPDILEKFKTLFVLAPEKELANIAISCFALKDLNNLQLELFCDTAKKYTLAKAVDSVNRDYGAFTLTTAQMVDTRDLVPDRIAFGGVTEL